MPSRHDDAFDDLVVRHVLLDSTMDPFVPLPGLLPVETLLAAERASSFAVAGEIAQAGGPPGRVGWLFEQLVYLAGTLVWRRVREKCGDFIRRGQRAGHVEADAAQELSVGAHLGRDDAELAQLGDHQLVDFRRR